MHSPTTKAEPSTLPRVWRTGVPRVISITGGKGGIGKSAIAVNLALALEQLGGRVLLVDGDFALANADQLLDAHPPLALSHVLCEGVPIGDAIFQTRYGVSILAGGSGRLELAKLGVAEWDGLLGQIRQMGDRFDYVVIDTAAGIDEISMRLTASADKIIVVATPDPASLRDAFAAMKVLSRERGVDRAELLLNMVEETTDGKRLYERLLKVVGVHLPMNLGLAGVVLRDRCFGRSILEKKPLVSCFPDSPARKQIVMMARQIVSCWNNEDAVNARGRLVS